MCMPRNLTTGLLLILMLSMCMDVFSVLRGESQTRAVRFFRWLVPVLFLGGWLELFEPLS